MIETILPRKTIAVETPHDAIDEALFSEEERAIERATEKRRKEFTTGRACAHQALRILGLPASAIPSGMSGEPMWPDGVVGSITHCTGYRACAVAFASSLMTLGIDAEPDTPLPDGILGDIARPAEREYLATLSTGSQAVCWDRLLFSVKEAMYKAWFPLTQRWLCFHDAEVRFEPWKNKFTGHLLTPSPSIDDKPLEALGGQWIAVNGIIVSACFHFPSH